LIKHLFLESSFLFWFVSPFSKKVGNEIKRAKKWYMIDVWFVNYILWINEYIWDFQWKIIENFVYNELSFYKESFEKIYFWQNRNWTEVDFLLIDNFDKNITPIEVKSWTRDNIPKSLLSFISKYKINISTSIITTKDFYKKRTENKKDFIFIPYMLIWKIKD
jgi:predicted AAA+ superfamily ATPase